MDQETWVRVEVSICRRIHSRQRRVEPLLLDSSIYVRHPKVLASEFDAALGWFALIDDLRLPLEISIGL